MKKTAIVLAISVMGLAAGQAMAQQSPWQIRARAVHLEPADKSHAIPGMVGANAIAVSDKTIPEIDISYFFTSFHGGVQREGGVPVRLRHRLSMV